MTITTLDPNTALIIVDLQKGIISRPGVHPMTDIVRNAAVLAGAFRHHDLPLVLVNVAGTAPGRTEEALSSGPRASDWADLVPELDQQAQDHRVTKRTWGAFTNTDLDGYLKGNEVTQVVIAGVATSIGVESTARQAHELGFNVTLAVDAMTDRNAEAHTNSLTRIFPKLGDTATTRDIIGLLGERSR
jgi:nicotinamidase-related amidase